MNRLLAAPIIWILAGAGVALVAVLTWVLLTNFAGSLTASTAPAPAGGSRSLPAISSPSPIPPIVTDPWAVLSAYYGDVESHDYLDAWNLLSPSFRETLGGGYYGNYQEFVAGYADTGAEWLTKVSESDDTVWISLDAYDTATGLWQYYSGSYTVDGGLITSGSITLTGQGQDE